MRNVLRHLEASETRECGQPRERTNHDGCSEKAVAVRTAFVRMQGNSRGLGNRILRCPPENLPEWPLHVCRFSFYRRNPSLIRSPYAHDGQETGQIRKPREVSRHTRTRDRSKG